MPDGRTIADLKLEAEPSLGDITLLESGGKYFLLTSDSAADDGIRRRHAPGQGGFQHGQLAALRRSICPSKPVGKGRLYAFDGHGKLLWPAPVKIEDQMLPLNQPADLPILTFACRVYDGKGGQKTSVLCIDKRNGRTVVPGGGSRRSNELFPGRRRRQKEDGRLDELDQHGYSNLYRQAVAAWFRDRRRSRQVTAGQSRPSHSDVDTYGTLSVPVLILTFI